MYGGFMIKYTFLALEKSQIYSLPLILSHECTLSKSVFKSTLHSFALSQVLIQKRKHRSQGTSKTFIFGLVSVLFSDILGMQIFSARKNKMALVI